MYDLLSLLSCHMQPQAAAERATSLRRTRDQASHRAEELKAHIKVQGSWLFACQRHLHLLPLMLKSFTTCHDAHQCGCTCKKSTLSLLMQQLTVSQTLPGGVRCCGGAPLPRRLRGDTVGGHRRHRPVDRPHAVRLFGGLAPQVPGVGAVRQGAATLRCSDGGSIRGAQILPLFVLHSEFVYLVDSHLKHLAWCCPTRCGNAIFHMVVSGALLCCLFVCLTE